jgi:hypothetical protein
MRPRRTWLPVPVIVSLTILAGCFADPSPAENARPVIAGFAVNGARVTALALRQGEQATILVVAWDPNGDTLQADQIQWTTSGGTIDPTGPSVRFVAPTYPAGPDSGEAREVRIRAVVTDGQAEPVTRTLLVQVLPPCLAENVRPTVLGVFAERESIELGDRVKVWVEAEDPEGSALGYTWTPPFGNIVGSGAEVEWQTTETCCTDYYDVEVVVSDGCKTSWSFVSVFVTT